MAEMANSAGLFQVGKTGTPSEIYCKGVRPFVSRKICGAAGEIRTPDLSLTKGVLYP